MRPKQNFWIYDIISVLIRIFNVRFVKLGEFSKFLIKVLAENDP